jgi:ABC-type multidrug transport system ATPase subunit
MKKDRAIIVTTHSMLEAETLSDKIAVLALGRMRAVGSPDHLKQRFGSSHQFGLHVPPHQVDAVKAQLLELAPEARFEEVCDGYLSFSVFQATSQKVCQIIQWLEEHSKSASFNAEPALLDSFYVQQSTLEQVFVRLTHGGPRASARGAGLSAM